MPSYLTSLKVSIQHEKQGVRESYLYWIWFTDMISHFVSGYFVFNFLFKFDHNYLQKYKVLRHFSDCVFASRWHQLYANFIYHTLRKVYIGLKSLYVFRKVRKIFGLVYFSSLIKGFCEAAKGIYIYTHTCAAMLRDTN
jgi:hypothetical protein